MSKVNAPKGWKTQPTCQTSEDTLWELTKNWNCYLFKSQGVTLSHDPLNLSGVHTKRDSGLVCGHAIGITFELVDKKVYEKKSKKSAKIMRFALNLKTKRPTVTKNKLVALPAKAVPQNNNIVFSSRRRVTLRSIVKTIKRDLTVYRKDLVHLAFLRLRKLNKFKKVHKNISKAEARKAKN